MASIERYNPIHRLRVKKWISKLCRTHRQGLHASWSTNADRAGDGTAQKGHPNETFSTRMVTVARRIRANPDRHLVLPAGSESAIRRWAQTQSLVEKQELVQLIEDYRKGLVPLVVPITLLRHHVAKHEISYLEGQLYLEPHPKELMLRNRVLGPSTGLWFQYSRSFTPS
jgi:hypothetical protein